MYLGQNNRILNLLLSLIIPALGNKASDCLVALGYIAEDGWDLSKLGLRDHLVSASCQIGGYGEMLAGSHKANARVSSYHQTPLRLPGDVQNT